MATAPDTKGFALRLPEPIYNRVKSLGFFTDRSMNDIIVTAVTEYLARTGDADQLHAIVQQARAEHRPLLDKLKEV